MLDIVCVMPVDISSSAAQRLDQRLRTVHAAVHQRFIAFAAAGDGESDFSKMLHRVSGELGRLRYRPRCVACSTASYASVAISQSDLNHPDTGSARSRLALRLEPRTPFLIAVAFSRWRRTTHCAFTEGPWSTCWSTRTTSALAQCLWANLPLVRRAEGARRQARALADCPSSRRGPTLRRVPRGRYLSLLRTFPDRFCLRTFDVSSSISATL